MLTGELKKLAIDEVTKVILDMQERRKNVTDETLDEGSAQGNICLRHFCIFWGFDLVQHFQELYDGAVSKPHLMTTSYLILKQEHITYST
ncbi:hypothetical protein Y032_0092g2519 [Ancylostoma ceylanicum]|nr:hypothetical protein Y032_0092g2519 [Ancylostoma ceylanicum]